MISKERASIRSIEAYLERCETGKSINKTYKICRDQETGKYYYTDEETSGEYIETIQIN